MRARNPRKVYKQKAASCFNCRGWCGEGEKSRVSKRNEEAGRSQVKAGG